MLAMRHSDKGMLMQRKILTLKPKTTTPPVFAPSVLVQAGRKPPKGAKTASSALLKLLNELIYNKQKAFIQMRHGTGYCGKLADLKDGWLRMEHVSIHGNKKSVPTPSILIQIFDGSYIAHIHSADSSVIGASK